MHVIFRPLITWPKGDLTLKYRRKSSPFGATYSRTLDQLDRELVHLGATELVIQLALDESEIRLDGMPRANASPRHPGVVLAFESKHGPLQYATDRFNHWQANVRAITLGLEALRKVDRYGITMHGEQYTGWKQLPPSSIEVGPASMTADEAAQFLIAHGEVDGAEPPHDTWELLGDHPLRQEVVDGYYRRAAKRLHPDHGGDPAMFLRLQQARDLLTRAA